MGTFNPKGTMQDLTAANERGRNLILAKPEGALDIEAVYRESIQVLHAMERATIEGVISTKLCDSVTRTSLTKLQYCLALESTRGCCIDVE